MSLRSHPPHSGLRRHGSPLGSASTMHQSLDNEELVEKKLMEEIKRLARENSQYAEAQVILRRDIISAKDEMQKMQALIRSIETESNIQVRVTFEKAAKMELECREAPQMKMELEKSHKEAQDMMLLVQEMTSQLDRANKELQIARTDTKKLPEMISELEDMREEHQRLCTTFEHEKRMNMEKVEHLQAMERDLINMARQIERLQADVSRAESALQTPPPALYGDLQSSSVQTHPPPAIHGNGPYYIASTGTYGQMGPVQMNGMVAHPHANHVAPPPTLPPPPPTLPPPPPPPISPSPPPPPPLHPPASGEGSGGDECTSVKGDNIGTDWNEEVGRCGSSESRVNEG